MEAYNLHDIGDLRFEEVDKPDLASDQVLVKVKACGICGSDIPRVYKNGTYSFPTIIGHEFSGIVEEISEDVDLKWKNKRVGVFPLIPCGTCPQCQKKKYEMCTSYNYLGSRCNGGMAEYVAVPAANLIELPDNVSFEQAAMLEPMAVAVHALRQCGFSADVPSDATIVIAGLGTIGLLVAMFLKDAGYENVLAIGNKDFQKKCFTDLGFEAGRFCDSKTQSPLEFIMEMTNNAGGDVFLECVGTNEIVTLGVQSLAAGGKLQLVGNPAGDMSFAKADYWQILRKQLKVTGTWNSSFTGDYNDDWHYVLSRLESGKIHPEKFITHRLAFEKLGQGFEIMKNRSENYVKVMSILGK